MKKKIMIMLVSLASMLASILGVQAATAPGAIARSCVIRGGPLDIPNQTVYGTTHDAKGYLTYRACGSFADQIEVSYQIYPGNDDCGFDGDGHVIKEYRFNMNAIGGFDPAMRAWDCSVGRHSYVTYKSANPDMRVYPGDPASERCTTATFKIVIGGDFDSVRSSSPECINF